MAAGLASVLPFPAMALAVMRGAPSDDRPAASVDAPERPPPSWFNGAMLSAMIGQLIRVIHPRLRLAIAVLWLAGAAIAGSTFVRATARMGVGSGLAFAAVALALTVLALGVLRAARWELAVSIVLAGAQLFGAVGAAWELVQGGQTVKTRAQRRRPSQAAGSA